MVGLAPTGILLTLHTSSASMALPGTRKRLYQFTAIDDCTRIRVLKVLPQRDVRRRLVQRVLDGESDDEGGQTWLQAFNAPDPMETPVGRRQSLR